MRANSHYTPSRNKLDPNEEVHDKGHHLMPKPSPRKMGRARELSESPERSIIEHDKVSKLSVPEHSKDKD